MTPDERADLTEAMVPEAANLAVLVHDADTEGIAEFMTRFGVTVPQGASPDDGAARLAVPITLKRGLTGAKPEAFCRWVLDLLGYDDTLDVIDDLFPGTGVMSQVARQGVLA